MISHAALPEGTVILVRREPEDVTAARTATGWAETDPHCVDCAQSWTADGTPNAYSTDKPLDLEAAEVVLVPAKWLAQRLLDALAIVESPDYYAYKPHKGPRDLEHLRNAVASLAVDAGLS